MNKINKLIKDSQNADNKLKRTFGIVEEYQDSLHKAKVILPEFNNQKMLLINRTHRKLKQDDTVWIYYWTIPSSGYIALKSNLGIDDNYNISNGTIYVPVTSSSAPYATATISVPKNCKQVIASLQLSISTPEQCKVSLYTYKKSSETYIAVIQPSDNSAVLPRTDYYINWIAIT